MWIGGIRLNVRTKDQPDAGTDGLLQAVILRDNREIVALNLDYPSEDDHERGASRNYDYTGPTKLQRRNDETPPLPPGIGRDPMPYPGYGIEFSSGMRSHLKIELRTDGEDMWIKDSVDLYVRQIRQVATSLDTLDWIEDSYWTYVASWPRDVSLSRDGSEGVSTWKLTLP